MNIDRTFNLRPDLGSPSQDASGVYSFFDLKPRVTEISQNTLTLTLRRALTLTLESAILAELVTLTEWGFEAR